MRVLIVSQYFPPETGGPQNRLAAFAEGFVDAGAEVAVVTQKPNYPRGVIWSEYRGGLFRERSFYGARVIHTTILEDRRKSFVSRIGYFLSFVLFAVLASFRLPGRYDLVIASSPPLFVGLAGWIIARLKRAKYIFDVRDLWPDVAIAMGELRNPRAQKLAKRLEHFIYRRADAITAVTDSFCEDIRKVVPQTPVLRVTNGTVPEHFRVDTDRDTLRRELDLPDGFIAAYVGNLGLAQGLDHIVDAASELSRTDPTVNVVVVGSGSAEESLRARAEATGAQNLIMRPRVDLETAAKYMAAADVLLVPLGNHPIYRKFIPSKLFDSMAAGRPLLLSVDGEARTLLEKAQAGWSYPAEDASALAATIRDARRRADELDEIGARGREFVEQHFTRSVQAARMVEIARDVAANNTPRPEQAAAPTGQAESDAPDEPRKQEPNKQEPHQQSATAVRIAPQAAPLQ